MTDTKISDARIAAAQERIDAYHPQPAELAEQQGDTRAQFEAWMTDTAKIIVGSGDPYTAGLERDYWRVWQAAIAVTGKQQVGKVPLCFITARDADQLRSHDVTLRHVATYWDRPGDDAVPVYLAERAPAQGIDLGQFRWVVLAAIDKFSRMPADASAAAKLRELLALIDSQNN